MQTHTIIQSLNTVSLRKHKDNILSDRSLMLSDILCLQETRLHENERISLGDFKSIASNGPHGVAIFYNQQLVLQAQHIEQTKHIEILYAHFITPIGQNIHIITLYRSPQSSPLLLIQTLQAFFLQRSCLDSVIVIGDFNIHASTTNTEYCMLEFFFVAHGIAQHILCPTTMYGSTLDHLWTSCASPGITFGTNYCFWSDHSIIHMLAPHDCFHGNEY